MASDPKIRRYGDAASLIDQTPATVGELIEAGHTPLDIAVLTWRGMNGSAVIGLDTLSGRPTQRFTGRYTEDGQAIVSEGELRLDTLFRFKGQAADCIVLTEIDFEEWSKDVRQRPFVGLTRARLKLVLVASERAEEVICERLMSPHHVNQRALSANARRQADASRSDQGAHCPVGISSECPQEPPPTTRRLTGSNVQNNHQDLNPNMQSVHEKAGWGSNGKGA